MLSCSIVIIGAQKPYYRNSYALVVIDSSCSTRTSDLLEAPKQGADPVVLALNRAEAYRRR